MVTFAEDPNANVTNYLSPQICDLQNLYVDRPAFGKFYTKGEI
jgi:hypothetical protein